MEGQVEGLTDRVADVDSSLNYMVGQLSLVVQEFNQVLKINASLKYQASYNWQDDNGYDIIILLLLSLQVKTNLADGINQLGGELEDIREYKPSNDEGQPNGEPNN